MCHRHTSDGYSLDTRLKAKLNACPADFVLVYDVAASCGSLLDKQESLANDR